MDKELTLSTCVRASVRGVTKVGLTATVSADIRDCDAKQGPKIISNVVLDAKRKPFSFICFF